MKEKESIYIHTNYRKQLWNNHYDQSKKNLSLQLSQALYTLRHTLYRLYTLYTLRHALYTLYTLRHTHLMQNMC
jgi:hypothetical protein